MSENPEVVPRGGSLRPRASAGVLNALLLLASLAFTSGLLEVVIRLVSHVSPSLLVTDATRGKHWVADYDASVFVPESGKPVRLRFHHDGFRGGELPYARPPGVQRIVVLGDSMIAAVAVEEPHTLVGRLEAGLNRDRGPTATGDTRVRVEVLNFGVSSASTGQELVTYRETARRYQPDLVLLAFNAGNDLADNCTCLSRAPRLYFELDQRGRLVERPYSPPAAALRAWLDRHSRLYVWQREAFARLRARFREQAGRLEPGAEIFRVDGTEPVETAWRVTDALFEAVRDATAADGARLAVLLVPAPEEIYDDLWRELTQRAGASAGALDRGHPGRRLAAIAARLGVPFLDLGNALRAAAPRRDSSLAEEQLYFFRRYHLNERGNAVAADAVQRWLEATGFGR